MAEHLGRQRERLVILPVLAYLDHFFFVLQTIDHFAGVDGPVGFYDDVKRVGHCSGSEDGAGFPVVPRYLRHCCRILSPRHPKETRPV